MSLKVVIKGANIPIGVVRHIEGKGWYFSTPIPGRRGSRDGHDSADAAIPAWVKKLGVYIQYPDFGS